MYRFLPHKTKGDTFETYKNCINIRADKYVFYTTNCKSGEK